MSDFEQMPMEPEVQEDVFLQILQDMEKLDLINSEFGGLSLPVKLLIGVLILVRNVLSFLIQQLGQDQEVYKEDDHWH